MIGRKKWGVSGDWAAVGETKSAGRNINSLERELGVKFVRSRLRGLGEQNTKPSQKLGYAVVKAMLKDQYLQRLRTVAERHGCNVCGREFSMTYPCEEDGVGLRCLRGTNEELVPDLSGLSGCQQLAWSCLMTMIVLSQVELMAWRVSACFWGTFYLPLVIVYWKWHADLARARWATARWGSS